MSTEVVSLLTAEIILAAVAVAIYIGGAFVEARGAWGWIASGALAMLFLCETTGVIGGSNPSADYVRLLALGVGTLFALMATRPLAGPGTSEYVGSLLLMIAGVMLVAGAKDLVLLFVGLELVSIPTYIVLYLGRRGAASQEATAKYFFLSILASAVLLYGFSFFYGVTGSTAIGPSLGVDGGLAGLANVALVLIFAGLGFKIAAVPFHFYAPDVYEGTTHLNAALLSIVPKIAGLIALVRMVGVGLEGIDSYGWQIAMVLAIVTMTFGNVMALWQSNVRRLLAYSSIAHAGYMLIGLSVYLRTDSDVSARWDGIGALLLYLLVYAVATIGTFAALACLGRGDEQIDSVDELAGLGWMGGPIRPLLAWLIALFMFSLAGIPPLAGFWGKLALFASALGVEDGGDRWFITLAVIGALNAAIAAAYYLRIVGTMFFRLPLGTPATREDAGGAFAAAMVCGVLVLAVGLYPGKLMREANMASPAQQASVAEQQPEATLAAR